MLVFFVLFLPSYVAVRCCSSLFVVRCGLLLLFVVAVECAIAVGGVLVLIGCWLLSLLCVCCRLFYRCCCLWFVVVV